MSFAGPKIMAGSRFPDLYWPAVGGGRVRPMADKGWRLLVVYRGRHCPICRQYLKTLNGMAAAFAEAGVTVYAVSADQADKATASAGEEGLTIPIGYDLRAHDMRTLSLYMSTPRSAEETDRLFAEPAAFAINPAGEIHMVDISNAPFARPELGLVLAGLKHVMSKGFATRGTA